MSQNNINKIKGRPILVEAKTGREISKEEAERLREVNGNKAVLDRHNGPHFNSKWARDLLNIPSQSEVRRKNRLKPKSSTISFTVNAPHKFIPSRRRMPSAADVLS